MNKTEQQKDMDAVSIALRNPEEGNNMQIIREKGSVARKRQALN